MKFNHNQLLYNQNPFEEGEQANGEDHQYLEGGMQSEMVEPRGSQPAAEHNFSRVVFNRDIQSSENTTQHDIRPQRISR